MTQRAAVLALLLAGCQAAATHEDSPYYRVPAGGKIVLHREIVIPADRTDVLLQDGKILPFSRINPYHPYCAFEVRHRRAASQTVAPGEFEILRAREEVVYSVRAPSPRPAAAGALVADDSDPGHQVYATVMDLHSVRQPEVLRLACAHWVNPPALRFLSLGEIRQALGQLLTLRPVPTRG